MGCFVAKNLPRLLLFLLFWMQTSIASSVANHSFQKLADEFFDTYYFPTYPTEATRAGIHDYDDKIEDYSLAGISKRIAQLKQFKTRVQIINPQTLDEQTQGDRVLILNEINSELLTLEQIKPLEKNPDIYSSGITGSAYVIMERKFASDHDRLKALVAREKLMPAILQQAHVNLKNPPKIYTQIALEQLPGLINFFQQDVPVAFNQADSDLLKQFNISNANVVAALKNYQIWLKNNVLPRSHGDFRIGKATFQKKLQYDEMVDLSLEKLLAINIKNMRENQRELQRIAKELYPNQSVQETIKSVSLDHPAPDHLLNSFKITFDNLIQFINEHHIITIPSDTRPIMQETPPFLRAITFASMDTPGPFEKHATDAFFNVTLPNPDWNKQAIAEFMGEFSYPSISSIAIHEAYPGHYVQFIWVPSNPDRVRKILGAASNYEGWAHYCEQMMLDVGYRGKTDRDTKLLRLGELLNALLRNARFTVGIQLHAGHMTFDQAVDYFVKEGYLQRQAALVETKRGTSNPTYLYYTLGKLEILKLRDDLQKKEGVKFNLQDFHDAMMRQGFPPIKIVRRALLHDNSPVL